jgi:hypothetical protein
VAVAPTALEKSFIGAYDLNVSSLEVRRCVNEIYSRSGTLVGSVTERCVRTPRVPKERQGDVRCSLQTYTHTLRYLRPMMPILCCGRLSTPGAMLCATRLWQAKPSSRMQLQIIEILLRLKSRLLLAARTGRGATFACDLLLSHYFRRINCTRDELSFEFHNDCLHVFQTSQARGQSCHGFLHLFVSPTCFNAEAAIVMPPAQLRCNIQTDISCSRMVTNQKFPSSISNLFIAA